MERSLSPGTHLPLLEDLKGFSKRVSLSVSTVRKFIGKGMPHIKPGRKILVEPQAAIDWLKQISEAGSQDDEGFEAYLDDILRQIE